MEDQFEPFYMHPADEKQYRASGKGGRLISAAVLALLLIGSASNGRKKPGKKGKAARVDRPHYYDRDDHECSVCGARFRQDTMTCPRCGTRFDVVKKDDREFIEEMTDEDDWDGEDG